ncbi:MAG TPA: DNA polymerase III subunit chi [Desulfuromonadales bacterium]|nr:DNA polymerase III subunit chi [Desulfuromonadales bacterium]
MPNVVVKFVKLERPERAVVLCDLAEEFFLQDQRVVIVVQDDNQGVTLDRFMWIWRKDAFVPHVYDNGAVDCIDEPVVITTREENRNGGQVLIQARPCSADFVRHFQLAIDFAEVYDDTLAEGSRERFKVFRKAGFDVGMR